MTDGARRRILARRNADSPSLCQLTARARALPWLLLLAVVAFASLGADCQDASDAAKSEATAITSAMSEVKSVVAANGYLFPMAGNIREIGYKPGDGDHKGSDLYAIDFTSDDVRVYPTRAGVVAFNAYNCDKKEPSLPSCYGNTVGIDHGDGTYSIYTHLKTVSPLKVGASVTTGTMLGEMSDSGCPDCGPHLHFVVRRGTAGLRDRSLLFGSADTPVDVRGKLSQR